MSFFHAAAQGRKHYVCVRVLSATFLLWNYSGPGEARLSVEMFQKSQSSRSQIRWKHNKQLFLPFKTRTSWVHFLCFSFWSPVEQWRLHHHVHVSSLKTTDVRSMTQRILVQEKQKKNRRTETGNTALFLLLTLPTRSASLHCHSASRCAAIIHPFDTTRHSCGENRRKMKASSFGMRVADCLAACWEANSSRGKKEMNWMKDEWTVWVNSAEHIGVASASISSSKTFYTVSIIATMSRLCFESGKI